MDITSVLSSFSSYTEAGIAFIVAALTLVAITSDHLLFVEFFHKRVFGKDFKINDPELAAFVNEEMDLIRARQAFPGLKFQSIEHAKAIFTFCKKYKIPKTQAKYLRSYFIYDSFESEAVSLKDISSKNWDKFFCAAMLGCIGFLLILILPILLASGNFGSVLIKTNDAHHYAWVNNDNTITNFRLPLSPKIELNSDICQNNITGEYFTKSEFDSLCKSINQKGEIADYVISEKLRGNFAFAIFFVILFPGFLIFKSEMKKIISLDRFRVQIRKIDEKHAEQYLI